MMQLSFLVFLLLWRGCDLGFKAEAAVAVAVAVSLAAGVGISKSVFRACACASGAVFALCDGLDQDLRAGNGERQN